jgi:lipopolysaccharide cholinephosphotransferase
MMEKREELKRLQACQLEMLKACIKVCERHKLRYFLLGGSALGAVRHSGFIPWDDDVDIGMPRPDYTRFLSIAKNELSPHLFLQTRETDAAYPMQFAKLRDSRTTFRQENVAHLDMNHGVALDIFPLDSCAASATRTKIRLLAFKAIRAVYQSKFGLRRGRRFEQIAVSVTAAIFRVGMLERMMRMVMEGGGYDESAQVVNWCGSWGAKEIVQGTIFGAGKDMRFEDVTARVPAEVHLYLSALYGEYMRMPPEEKRVPPHTADLIDLDSPYTIYQPKEKKYS